MHDTGTIFLVEVALHRLLDVVLEFFQGLAFGMDRLTERLGGAAAVIRVFDYKDDFTHGVSPPVSRITDLGPGFKSATPN